MANAINHEGEAAGISNPSAELRASAVGIQAAFFWASGGVSKVSEISMSTPVTSLRSDPKLGGRTEDEELS